MNNFNFIMNFILCDFINLKTKKIETGSDIKHILSYYKISLDQLVWIRYVNLVIISYLPD